MKFTVNKLMEHPTYFHRVVGYAFRNSRFLNDLAVHGEELGPDDRLYIRLDQIKPNPSKVRVAGRKDESMTRKLGVLGYVNDFEMVKHKYKFTGKQPKPTPTWEELNSSINEAGFTECSDDYTKIMLFLNFAEREDFYRKFIQYKIGIFGHSTKLSTEERKVVVSNIKKDSREYLDFLKRDIYYDVFSLLLNNYYDLKTHHQDCVRYGRKLNPKKEEDLSKVTQLIVDNREVIESWKHFGGQKYFNARLEAGDKTYQNPQLVAGSPYLRQQNIMYRLPQMSSLHEEMGACRVVDILDIDYVPIFQAFIDDFKQDYLDTSAQTEAEATAQRGAN